MAEEKRSMSFGGLFGKKNKSSHKMNPSNQSEKGKLDFSCLNLDTILEAEDPVFYRQTTIYNHPAFENQPYFGHAQKIGNSENVLHYIPYLKYISQEQISLQNQKYSALYALTKLLISTPGNIKKIQLDDAFFCKHLVRITRLGMCTSEESWNNICDAFEITTFNLKPSAYISELWKDLLQKYSISETSYTDILNNLIKYFEHSFYLQNKSELVKDARNINIIQKATAINWNYLISLCTENGMDARNPLLLDFITEMKNDACGLADYYVYLQDLTAALAKKNRLSPGKYVCLGSIFSEDNISAAFFDNMHQIITNAFIVADKITIKTP